MFPIRAVGRIALLGLAAALVVVPPALPQAKIQSRTSPEPLANTRLLMRAINWPNYQGLDQELRQWRADANFWTQIENRALLIAENANLLLLRSPPHGGLETWLDRAADLRTAAAELAQAAAKRDYAHSRAGLTTLAHACQRCHQTFHVAMEVVPFTETPTGRILPPLPPPPPEPPAPPAPRQPPAPWRPPA